MKIFDCFMYFDEELILELRLNILKNFVDYFVIIESRYAHNGKKRELKFNIEKFKDFKKKIIYIIHENEPKEIKKIYDNDDEPTKSSKYIYNAHLRENDQRNHITNGLKIANEEDLIMISDVDEIPNLSSINFEKSKKKIFIFKQYIFYYKLNRYLPNFTWYGTKACKKKNLLSPQWLRNVKSKKYHFWRIDAWFSKKQYIGIDFVKNGGWHFSNIKKAEDIEFKLKSYLHHRDYEVEALGIKKIKNIIEKRETLYDMYVDKSGKKFHDKRQKLEKFEINKLPNFIESNLENYKEWID